MACPRRANRTPEGAALCAALLGAVLGVSCGKKGSGPRGEAATACPASPVAPDLSSPEAALACASRAVAEGDYEALRACTTAEGLEGVRRDLLAWNALLADAVTGPRVLARIPSPRDDADKALYRAGFSGDPAALLTLLARTEGAAAGPRVSVAAPAAGVERLEVDRALADGTRRRVVLVRRDGAWKVDRIAL